MTKEQARASGFLAGVAVTTLAWSVASYLNWKADRKAQEKLNVDRRILWTASGIVTEKMRRGDYDHLPLQERYNKSLQDLEFERIRVGNDELSDFLKE